MPSRFRLPLIAAALALAFAGAGYTAYWFHVAAKARETIAAWSAERRAAGWAVEMGEVGFAGFPFALRAHIPAPLLAAPDGTSWSAEALAAETSPFDLSRVAIAAPGRHVLGWAGHELPLRADRLDLRLDFAPPAGENHQRASLAFSLALGGLLLPELPELPLDREIAAAAVEGRVMGALGSDFSADGIAAWSRDGGTVEIDRLALDWAPLALEAEGTFAFDPALQPLVALSARVRGYSELMDRLARAGVIDAANANLAKMLLGLMAKPDPQGRQALPVPVTLQDGDFYIGPARVARVPPLAW